MPTKQRVITICDVIDACAQKAQSDKTRMGNVALVIELEDGEHRLVSSIHSGQMNGKPALILYAGIAIEEE